MDGIDNVILGHIGIEHLAQASFDVAQFNGRWRAENQRFDMIEEEVHVCRGYSLTVNRDIDNKNDRVTIFYFVKLSESFSIN